MAAMMKTKEEKQNFLISISHDDVVKSPDLFIETVKCFHSLVGTKFMIPVIGKKTLDLHSFYLEVTKRGGYQKVVDGKMWLDISRLFQYPPTSTNTSYLLKNHYCNLLYQFEKFYFFKVNLLFATPTGGLSDKSPACALVHDESTSCMSTGQQTQPQVGGGLSVKSSACAPVNDESTLHVSTKQQAQPQIGVSEFPTVMGTIDAKFEHGYLVTVKMGSEYLPGVLYQSSSTAEETNAMAQTVEGSTSMAPNVCVKPELKLPVTKKRRSPRVKVPEKPKTNKSAYNFFFSDKYSQLKDHHSKCGRDFTKIIAESWNNLSQEEKVVYEKLALSDKERYRKEKQEYKKKLHGGISRGM